MSTLETFSVFRIVRRIGTLPGVCIKSFIVYLGQLASFMGFLGTSRWFRHVLPQLRERRVGWVGLPKIEIDRTRIKRDTILHRFQLYGRRVMQFVQRPGEAFFLPSGMPHAVLNLRDSVAVTRNHLFVDALDSELHRLELPQGIFPLHFQSS